MIIYTILSLSIIAQISILLFYSGLLWQISRFWAKEVKKNTLDSATKSTISFVVIIPARNEDSNITECINSILNQNYKAELFKILVVDDHSTDRTFEIVSTINSPQLSILQLPSHLYGKKSAMMYAARSLTEENVILFFTDADCVWQENVLNAHSKAYGGNPQTQMVAGQIENFTDSTVINLFQSMDLRATMALTYWAGTKGLFYLANGAHLSIKKDEFLALDPYSDNLHLPSGDDVFLARKVALSHDSTISRIRPIKYLFPTDGSMIHTRALSTWPSLLAQRARWASKTSAYAHPILFRIKLLIFLQAVAILCTPIYTFIGVEAFDVALLGLVFFTIKLLVDFLFLRNVSYKERSQYSFNFKFIATSFLYLFYFLFMGYSAVVKPGFNWKGRQF